MKRRLALSLAALLLLGCLTPALAAEGDAELSLYQQYGPWGEWPQEQKDAAEETWTASGTTTGRSTTPRCGRR